MCPILSPVFLSKQREGFDVNSTSNMKVDVSGYTVVMVQAFEETGTFATAVLTAQQSADPDATPSTFVDIPGKTLTGPGIIDDIQITAEHLRIRVTTPEGAPGTARIVINAKR